MRHCRERPCQQCVRKGRPDHCCDPPPRKKGRPARNDPRYRSKHALPPPPEPPQPQPPTGIGRADDEVVLLLIEEVVRLRRELEAAQLELAQVGASTSAEVAEGGVGWRKRPRSDGPVVEGRSSSSPTVPVVPAEDAEGIDDGETDSALREARARMPFLRQYRLGPDRPFVVRDLFELRHSLPALLTPVIHSQALLCACACACAVVRVRVQETDIGVREALQWRVGVLLCQRGLCQPV
jgi:hypothetical protein